jgi:chorismate mutase
MKRAWQQPTLFLFAKNGSGMERSDRMEGRKVCRGVRGATIASGDSRDEIHAATRELVVEMMHANGIEQEDLASAFFTTTPDLRAAYPAEAARLLGWEYVPMLGAVEMDKQGGPARCIRVMLHWNTTRGQREIRHIYLKGTESLRTVGASEVAPAHEAMASNNHRKDGER